VKEAEEHAASFRNDAEDALAAADLAEVISPRA
jgi:hypothetical protein